MKQTIRSFLVLAGVSLLSAPAYAVTITVTAGPGGDDLFSAAPDFVDKSPNTSDDALLPVPPATEPVIGDGSANGTPGVCTLREAILTAEGQRSPTAADCARYNVLTGALTSKPFAYCPFSGGTLIAGECDPEGAATAASADEIVFAPSSRGTHRMDFTLPQIKNPLTIRGLGPDQTIITGDADKLAAPNPPPAIGAAITSIFRELAIFQIHPDLPENTEIKFENLAIRGTRIHYYRSPSIREVVTAGTPPAGTATSNCVGPTDLNPNGLPPCCGTQPNNSPNADVGASYGGCSATEPSAIVAGSLSTRAVINFAGIVMDNGFSSLRKKLTLSNTRMACNRRGINPAGSRANLGGHPGHTPNNSFSDLMTTFTGDGGAIWQVGKALLNLQTATFSNNVSEVGSGGAVFAGSKDNGSPEVMVVNSRFDADALQGCTDTVFAIHRNGGGNPSGSFPDPTNDTATSSTGAVVATGDGAPCNSSTSPANLNSACPTATHVGALPPGVNTQVYTSYAPGNFAGAAAPDHPSAAVTQLAGPFARVAVGDAASATQTDGGALAINALDATVTNIGPLTLTGSRFSGSSARRDGGALSIAHVARESASTEAFTLTDVLFSSPDASSNGPLPAQGNNLAAGNNRAAGNGGAISIIGNSNQPSSARFSVVSMSFNRANGDGGGMHYTTRPGRPIDFSLTNVRVGANSSGGNGAGIFAADNGVDDSGLLNVSKVTFDNNQATGGGGGLFCGATKQGSQFTNVTMSANVAATGGGIFIGDRCHISFNNATIVDNTAVLLGTIDATGSKNGGGGIFVDPAAGNGNVVLRNTIVAENKSVDRQTNVIGQQPQDATPDIRALNGPDCSAPNREILRTAGFNFIGTNTGCGPTGQDNENQPFRSGVTVVGGATVCLTPGVGDIVGNRARTDVCDADPNPLDPQLRVLSDNGARPDSLSNDILGARNFTHLPETGSRVINNGSTSGCVDGLGAAVTEDERSFLRNVAAGRCDIGAVELNGGLTPEVATLAIESVVAEGAFGVRRFVQLPRFAEPVELLRLRITGPSTQVVRIQALTIRKEDVESGAFGRFDSAVGYEVVAVDEQGNIVLTNKLFTVASPPVFDATTGQLAIPFTSPLELQPSQVRFISVRLVFDAGQKFVAKAETGMMVAAASGLGLVSFIGLMGAGLSRRKSLSIALLLLLAAAGGGCSDDDGGAIDEGTRTFRISARQLVFDTEAQTGNAQNLTAFGPTVTVKNP